MSSQASPVQTRPTITYSPSFQPFTLPTTPVFENEEDSPSSSSYEVATTTAAATAATSSSESPIIIASGSVMTTLPTSDIGKLSYYLKCCVLGCGMPCGDTTDISFDLFDYDHAHTRLTIEQQEHIYKLVSSPSHSRDSGSGIGGDYAFHDHVMNRYIFVDEQHQLLPRNMDNVFINIPSTIKNKTTTTTNSTTKKKQLDNNNRIITTLRSIVSSSASSSSESNRPFCKPIIGGQQQVMLCTKKWVQDYYVQPLARYIQEREFRSLLVFQQQQQQQDASRASAGDDTTTTASDNNDDQDAYVDVTVCPTPISPTLLSIRPGHQQQRRRISQQGCCNNSARSSSCCRGGTTVRRNSSNGDDTLLCDCTSCIYDRLYHHFHHHHNHHQSSSSNININNDEYDDSNNISAVVAQEVVINPQPQLLQQQQQPQQQEQQHHQSHHLLHHSNVQCNNCMIYGIRGTRYRCITREDFDLCEQCYYNGNYDIQLRSISTSTSSTATTSIDGGTSAPPPQDIFERIEYPGATPEALVSTSASSAHYDSNVVSYVKDSKKKRIYNDLFIKTSYDSEQQHHDVMIPIVEAVPVSSTQGNSQSCSSNKRRKTTSIATPRRRKVAARKKKKTDSAAWFIPGQSVRIVNLPKSRSSLNERLAIVMERHANNGQIVVRTTKKKTNHTIQVCVQAKNLIIVMD